jgi:hypothetical protein
VRCAIGLALLTAGCNQLIGVHDYGVDAAGQSCTGCQCAVDTDCTDPHAVCDQTKCTCSAGYALGSDGCVWVGVVDDPGFERSPDHWVPTLASTISPSTPQGAGMLDPGEMQLSGDASCTYGSFSQTLTMPRFSRSDALVMSATYNYAAQGLGNSVVLPSLALGSSWFEYTIPPAQQTFATTRRICLGEGQYAPESSSGLGAPIDLVASADDATAEYFGVCNGASTVAYDHLDIVPAAPDECPLPGQITNGDAEGNGGWALSGAAALESCPAPINSRCVHLHQDRFCSPASAEVLVSVPLATATQGAALTFTQDVGSTLAPNDVALSIDNVNALTVVASASAASYCLPAYMRGGVFALRAGFTSSGKCLDGDLYLDNVSIANVAACGADPYISDPSFESAFPPVNASGSVTADLGAGSNAARTGSYDLKLEVVGACSSQASWKASVLVPTTMAKPALSFYYRFPARISSTFSTGPATLTPLNNASDNNWQQGKICLGKQFKGKAEVVLFRLLQGGGVTCPTSIEDVYLDDLSVVDEPTCP